MTTFRCITARTLATNGPAYATGWFAGAGVKINTPMIGPGDYFSAQFNYTVGAAGYADDGATNGAGIIMTGGQGGNYSNLTSNSFGYGVVSDAVYGASGNMDLTTVWGVNAAYEHFWNKRWQTSIYGGYIASSYDSTANANLCAHELAVITAVTSGACSNNWNYWDVGTRTQFNVDSQTYIGLDVIYTALQTGSNGVVGTVAGSATQPSNIRTIANQSAWTAEFRFHRNFYP